MMTFDEWCLKYFNAANPLNELHFLNAYSVYSGGGHQVARLKALLELVLDRAEDGRAVGPIIRAALGKPTRYEEEQAEDA